MNLHKVKILIQGGINDLFRNKLEECNKMGNYQNDNQKLPMFGIGPYLILAIAVISLLGILLSDNFLLSGSLEGLYKIIFYIVGAMFVVIGLGLWYLGAVKSNIDQCIMKNKLKTTGVFSLTRNPMYSGWWFFMIGLMCFWHNLWLVLIIPVQWLVLTLVLCHTEEKWLYDLYGDEYEKYCRKVNRLIPIKKLRWFKKK